MDINYVKQFYEVTKTNNKYIKMNVNHVKYLVCPKCSNSLELKNKNSNNKNIESGILKCNGCDSEYPIIRSIPRFVDLNNYASGFGFQWKKHSRTQYDSTSGLNISEKRFFESSKWNRDLKGETILEVGSGSGRFTEHAVSTGAMVISLDYSVAVEANYASNGHNKNLLIVQGDVYNLPFRKSYFDKVICIGVLQHTPDVKKTFYKLCELPKSGGKIVVDVYKKHPFYFQIFKTKYWARHITKRIKPELLYKIISSYVKFMWPLTKLINKLPYGHNINFNLLISDYRGILDLDEDKLLEWAILDSFDALPPAYDSPQTINTLKKWFIDNNLQNIDIHYGYNGIEGRGIKH